MSPESADARRSRARRVVRALARRHPEPHIALRHRNAFELLVATILSAQCTDQKVNEVTAELFLRYPTPRALAEADPSELEAAIRSTGFYRQKARSLLATASDLCERFGGEVPRTLEELVSLRGVARKTANVVLGEAFGIPGLAVDTHMKRVNQRLGFTRHDDPVRIEQDLMELLPRSQWTDYTRRVILHGRLCCKARAPLCEECPLRELCPWPGSARPAPRRRKAPRRRS